MCRLLLASFAACAVSSQDSHSQEFESAELEHSDLASSPVSDHAFGEQVAISGEWIAISDVLDYRIVQGVQRRVGTVQMYRRGLSGWEFTQLILPPILPEQGEDYDTLGYYMAIHGDTMALGGVIDRFNNFAGTVWIYQFDGDEWVVTERVDPLVHRAGVEFGYGVVLNEDSLYVTLGRGGIPDPIVAHVWSGAIERFTRGPNGWDRVESILPVSTTYQRRFCVGPFDVNGDVLATRCAEGPNSSANHPYLRIFEGGPGQWAETAIFPGITYPSVITMYGADVGVWEDWVAVGVPSPTWNPFFGSPVRAGHVAMYHRTAPGNWVLQDLLTASDGWIGTYAGFQMSDQFGWDIDFDDGRLLIGATRGRNLFGERMKGGAYLFEYNGTTWVETRRFTSTLIEDPSFTFASQFGSGVGIDASYVVVSDNLAPLSPTMTLSRVGRAYVYETSIGDTICAGAPNPTGSPATLELRGSATAHAGVIDFAVTGMPPTSPGLLFAGQQATNQPNPGGGAGNLCVTGGVVRLRTAAADGTGRWTHALELPEPGQSGTLPVTAGSTWYFQLWYRQPGSPPSSNFSSAVRVMFE